MTVAAALLGQYCLNIEYICSFVNNLNLHLSMSVNNTMDEVIGWTLLCKMKYNQGVNSPSQLHLLCRFQLAEFSTNYLSYQPKIVNGVHLAINNLFLL